VRINLKGEGKAQEGEKSQERELVKSF